MSASKHPVVEAISKKSFDLISAVSKKLNPRNINYITPVKFFLSLELKPKSFF
jgi:hypothetical protein